MSGSKIIDGLNEAVKVSKGQNTNAKLRLIRVPENVDVKSIRAKLNMSQMDFSENFGFELSTVRNWEQGRRMPEKPARMLLRIIEESPETVEKVLKTG